MAPVRSQARSSWSRSGQLLWLLLPFAASCGTDAVGVETCRSIEFARCEAARACGLVEDVESCHRYARDHCLHGIAVEAPTDRQVNLCIATLEALEKCARKNGKRSSLAECTGGGDLGTEAENVCELVVEPELAPRCQFLIPPEPEPEPAPEPAPDAGED